MRRFVAALLLVNVIGCVSSSRTRVLPVYTMPPRSPANSALAPAVLPSQQLPAARRLPPRERQPQPSRRDTDPGAGGEARVLNAPTQPKAAAEQAPPSEPSLYCALGPQMLQRVDEMEQEGQAVTLEFHGTPETAEEMAGRFIDGCVEQLGELATPGASSENELLSATAVAWKANLAYMQWWLMNRRANQPEQSE